jgi:hypothetical protein
MNTGFAFEKCNVRLLELSVIIGGLQALPDTTSLNSTERCL